MKKIFNLGMPKTGTTSFHLLMHKVGIKTRHDNQYQEGYDSFSGGIVDQYETLYTKFPDAKFVLTMRDEEHWLKSVIKWFDPNFRKWNDGNIGKRTRIFGTKYVSTLSDKELLNIYNSWNNKIREFFKDKDNFMEINFINYFGDTKQLCQRLLNFLEIDTDIVDIDFPHVNKNEEDNKWL